MTAIAKPTTAWLPWRDLPRQARIRIIGAGAYVALITLSFSGPLGRLVAYASENSLSSHVPLVPLIAAYLLYLRRKRYAGLYRTSLIGTTILSGIAFWSLHASTASTLSVNDDLTLASLSYVSLIAAGGFLFLGARWMAAAAFPACFLVFMIPLPDTAVYWLERGLVVASANAAAVLFRVTGTPLWRDGTVLALPGIVLQVAQECSGIRSSWVLFITSLLASQLLLTSSWRRAVLVGLVLPLGILRNAFRIVVIGLLCVHIGPHMIDSPIHRRGGPIFFALSLVPLFLAAMWLHRQERRHSQRSTR